MFKKVQVFDNIDMDLDKSYQRLVARIASNVKKLRISNGLTQEQMVEHGFNYRHYQKIESGKHSPSLYTLYRLAKFFKTEISDLVR